MMKIISAYVFFLFGLILVSCSSSPSSSNQNTPPIGLFTVIPDSGTTSTIFLFDASNSFDIEDSLENLLIRWDWENDSEWDTEFLSSKKAMHQFKFKGTFNVKMEIKDSGKETNSAEKLVQVKNYFSSVSDIDGNIYKTVKIGDQWWMAENLRVTHYRNGHPIPQSIDNGHWTDLVSGIYCSYNNESQYDKEYGLLYNWYAVIDNRGIAPDGWHVATDEDWRKLEIHLGVSPEITTQSGSHNGGGKLKEEGILHWDAPNEGATNETGFSALPAGYRLLSGFSSYMGKYGYWWSSTEYDSNYVWFEILSYNISDIYHGFDSKDYGYSVRCVKD